MKTYFVDAFFSELPSGRAEQSCSLEACSMGTAARRGLFILRQRPGIRGKRIKVVRLTIREGMNHEGMREATLP